MSLAPGTRLGPYEVVAPIGAGGMGEVYRGRDTRLDRSVAIKVLAPELGVRIQIRERFEREAKAISSLSHAHICPLFDVGHENGTDYLVMEYLEGETLAERLARGPLPVEQVIRFGAEIADALAAAHRQGIVHRDLKPGNVILTKSGVKLLDFGLAKLRESGSILDGMANLATEHRPLTEEGTILGTFQYMAPEQVEAGEVDARTDIFAFGALLYEMVTGQRAFDGKTKTSVIAAILDREPPPIATMQPLAPPVLDRVIRKCLAKNPDDRWQSAHDVAAELRWIADAGSQAGVAAPVVTRRKRRESVAWLIAALSLLIAVVLGVKLFRVVETPVEPVQSSILPPRGSEFAFAAGPFALSPDGTRIAFIAQGSTGENMLWIRPLRGAVAQPLAGTEDASYPFWSPDSRFLAFFTGGKLRRISVNGGPAQTVCDAANGRGGTWSGRNVILFGLVRDGIYQVTASGGNPAKIRDVDTAAGEADLRWPSFLPDDEHYLFLARAEVPEESVAWVAALGSKERTRVTQASGQVQYASGRLLFTQARTLLAQPFDLRALKLSGDPVPLAEEISYVSGTASAMYSASTNGELLYSQGAGNSQLEWVDRTGKQIGRVGSPGDYTDISISPDGSRLAAAMNDASGKADIWIHDLVRSTVSRFTFKPSDELSPVWSPDGGQIAYSTGPKRPAFDIAVKSVRAAGAEQLVWEAPQSQRIAQSWSQDGTMLLVGYHDPKGKVINDIWLYSLPDKKATPLVQSPFSEFPGTFSPDGDWFVYASNESGRSEIYVQPIGRTGKWQVSSKGGIAPMWSAKGDEIFYMTLDRKVMAVPVRTNGSDLEIGDAAVLFTSRATPLRVGAWKNYDVMPDGQRFIIVSTTEDSISTPATLITNWPALVK